MSTDYNATIEFDTPATASAAERVVDALSAYHPAAGRSDRGRLEVTLTVPAADFVQLMQTTVAITARAIDAPVLRVEFTPTEEFDRRQGLAPIPELVSVAEAAEILGVTRQAVQQRLESGSLPGRRVGKAWVIQRAAVER